MKKTIYFLMLLPLILFGKPSTNFETYNKSIKFETSFLGTAPTSITGTTTICKGTSTTLTATGGMMSPTGFYQWGTGSALGSAIIVGQTAASITVSPMSDTVYWVRRVDNVNNNISGGITQTVSVGIGSVGGTLSADQGVCIGTSASDIVLTGNVGNVVKWQKSEYPTFDYSTDIASTSTRLLANTLDLLNTTTYYRAVVANGSCSSAFSSVSGIVVVPVPVGGTIVGSSRICSGSNITLILASRVGSIIKWQSSTTSDFSSNVSDIANTTQSLTTPILTTTTYYRAIVQTGACLSAYSSTGVATVLNPSTSPTLITGATAICKGTSITLTASGGILSSTGYYQWGTGSTMGSNMLYWERGASITVSPTSDTVYWVRRMETICNKTTGGVTQMVSVSNSSIGGTLVNQEICIGTSTSDIVLTGNVGNVVKWQKSNDATFTTSTDIVTTSERLLSSTIGLLNTTSYYRAVVQSGACSSAFSSVSRIVVAYVPLGGTVSGSTRICSGSNAILVLANKVGSILKWQSSTTSDFSSNVTEMANTTQSLTTPGLTTTTYYRAVVQSGACLPVYSSTGVVAVEPVAVGGIIDGSVRICPGSNAILELSNKVGSILKWQSSTASDFSSNVSDIATTASSLTTPSLTTTTYYRVVVQNGVCSLVYSSTGAVSVEPVAVGGAINEISRNCSGSNATLELVNKVGNVIKWQSCTASDFSSNVSDIANTTPSLTTPSLTTTSYYRAVVQSGACSSAYSSTGVVTIENPSTDPTLITGTTAICKGASTTLTAIGGILSSTGSYQWGTGSTVGSTIITGQTAASITVSPTSDTVYWVRRADSVCNHSTGGVTQTVSVSISSVGGSTLAKLDICAGTSVPDIVLTGNVGNVVKWQKSNSATFATSTDIACTSTTLLSSTIGLLYAETFYRAVVANGSCSSAFSSVSRMVVAPVSVGGTMSGNVRICSGSNATLILASRVGSIIKWQSSISSDFSSNVSDIPNTTQSLTTPSLTTTTYYRAVVQSGACSSAYSLTGVVTVDAVTIGGTIGGSARICPGSNGVLMLANKAGNIIKWQSSSVIDFSSNVTDIANTTPSLTTPNLSYTTYYRAMVQNGACSSAYSSTGTITIDLDGTITGSKSYCAGSTNSTVLALTGIIGNVLKWQSSSVIDFSSKVTDIANTSQTLTTPNLTTTTYYRAVLQGGGDCSSSYSSTGAITVAPVTVGGTITGSKSYGEISANLTVLNLIGKTGNVLKWQSSISADFSGFITDIVSNSATLVVSNSITTTYYRVLVQSGVCSSAYSSIGEIAIGLVSLSDAQCGTTLENLDSSIYPNPKVGAQAYRYQVTNGIDVRVYEPNTALFNLTQLPGGATYKTTYSIQISVKINGVWGEFGTPCSVTTPLPVTKVKACGITLSTISTSVYADALIGVQGYRFEVTDPTNNVRTFEAATNLFNLTQLTGVVAYNTTYSIRVAANANGVWGAYGTSCSVTTPAVAPTKLMDSQCGTTLAALNSSVYYGAVYGAQAYRFEVTKGTAVVTYDLTNTANLFNLTQPSGGASFATAYSVRVASNVNGAWSPYGTACSITTPAAITKVKAAICGTTLATLTTSVYADALIGVQSYRFEVTEGTNVRTFDAPSNLFNLAQLTAGAAYGTTYAIRVAVNVNGVSGAYGASCNVATPIKPAANPIAKQAAKQTAKQDSAVAIIEYTVKAYPNPFSDNFKLLLTSASEDTVEVLVYDLLGRKITGKTIRAVNVNTVELGEEYSAGVYNVIIRQGKDVKTLRMIKR